MTPAAFRAAIMALPAADRDAVLEAACAVNPHAVGDDPIVVIATVVRHGVDHPDFESYWVERAFAAIAAAESPAVPLSSTLEASGANVARLRAVLVAVSNGVRSDYRAAIFAVIAAGVERWDGVDIAVLAAACLALAGDVADWQVEAAVRAARELGVEVPS